MSLRGMPYLHIYSPACSTARLVRTNPPEHRAPMLYPHEGGSPRIVWLILKDRVPKPRG